MHPSPRVIILDILFLFGSLMAAKNPKKHVKTKTKNRPSAASPTPHSYRLMPGFAYFYGMGDLREGRGKGGISILVGGMACGREGGGTRFDSRLAQIVA